MTVAMPLIPTTVCGSHGLPSWIHLVREAAQADRLGPIDLQEAYEDAVRLAIRDQVEAGVDVKAFRVETAEEVAERARLALKHVPAERLWLVPDCGLWETPRWVGVSKLRSMVEAARMLRRELGRA